MKKFNIMATSLLAVFLTMPTAALAQNITVQSGDTLFSIANKNKTTVDKLITLNNLSSNTIRIGQTLKVSEEKKEFVYITSNSGLFLQPGKTLKGIITPQRVKVLEEGTDGWFKIQTWLGPLWTKNGFMKEVNDNVNTIDYYYITSKSGLFQEPGKTLKSIIAPQRVKILQEGNDGWLKIQTWLGPLWMKNGIMKENVVPVKPPVDKPIVTSKAKTTANLNLRATNSATGKILATIPEGTTVTVLDKSASWWKLQYKGETGYSSKTYLTTDLSEEVVVPDPEPVVDSKKVFIRPAEGVITSEMGPRWGKMHYGVDIAKSGSVQVKAGADGVVSRSYLHSSYGEVVFIRHEIDGQKYETVYAHMRSLTRQVKVGDKVTEGQFLGWMGSTGNSTGQHLHFEVHLGDYVYTKTHVNPLLYIK